jgi:hypothetical protein
MGSLLSTVDPCAMTSASRSARAWCGANRRSGEDAGRPEQLRCAASLLMPPVIAEVLERHDQRLSARLPEHAPTEPPSNGWRPPSATAVSGGTATAWNCEPRRFPCDHRPTATARSAAEEHA